MKRISKRKKEKDGEEKAKHGKQNNKKVRCS